MEQQADIRVLIIDDSHFIRQIFTNWLKRDRMVTVVATAGNVSEAKLMIDETKPDIITLDADLPMVDVVTLVKRLTSMTDAPILMVSTLRKKAADITMHALKAGAYDFIVKPSDAEHGGWEITLTSLTKKIKTCRQARLAHAIITEELTVAPAALPKQLIEDSGILIGFGASTGGIEVLCDILQKLPNPMPPIVITQHLPPVFTTALAELLHKTTSLNVVEAQHQQKLQSGHAYIAPGFHHLRIHKHKESKHYWCLLEEGEPVSGQCPSIDVMMSSMAEKAGKCAVGVLLTGNGVDGAYGMRAIQNIGGHIILQDVESTRLSGMIDHARSKKVTAQPTALQEIPKALIQHCQEAGYV